MSKQKNMTEARIIIQTRAQHDAGEPIIPLNPPADDAREALYVVRANATLSGQAMLCICVEDWLHPGHWIVTDLTQNMVEAILGAMRGVDAREQIPRG
jgi:hypothetical protein